MKYICENCGSVMHLVGNKLVCQCGWNCSLDDYKETYQENRNFVDKFINRYDSYIEEAKSKSNEITELKKEVSSLKGDLVKEINESMKIALENSIEELEEYIQSQLPTIEYNEPSERITTQEIIERAQDIDDFRNLAFMIRNSMEDNLINKFHVRHEGVNFVISYEDMMDMKNNYKVTINDKVIYPFRSYKLYSRNIIKKDANGNPIDVEMLPKVRFIKAGFDYETAKKLSEYWVNSNLFIHPCKENNDRIEVVFKNIDMKQYFEAQVKYIRDKGLYTRK